MYLELSSIPLPIVSTFGTSAEIFLSADADTEVEDPRFQRWEGWVDEILKMVA
jgi:hypothetical protein